MITIHSVRPQKIVRFIPPGWTPYYATCSDGGRRKGLFFTAPTRQGARWAREAAQSASTTDEMFKALVQRMHESGYYAQARSHVEGQK